MVRVIVLTPIIVVALWFGWNQALVFDWFHASGALVMMLVLAACLTYGWHS